MGNISILDRKITDLFAANEIAVNRYYAIKELLDNSIDACSTKIEVLYGKAAGSSDFIVRDNGCGISNEDLNLCSQKFATSKTKELSDVYSPKNLGYRGEALHSLFASSRVTITSRLPDEDAWKISSEYLGCSPSSGALGTEVNVSDFLGFIPARKATLSHEGYEKQKIIDLLRDYAILFPDIEFKYNDILDQKQFRTSSNNKYVKRIQDLYKLDAPPFVIESHDDELSINLVAFEARKRHLVSVNGRLIKSKKITEMLQHFMKSNYGLDKVNVSLIMNVSDAQLVNFHSCPYKEKSLSC